MSKTQIGWYHLKEDKEFMNTFECAAWYERVLVKAGTYPVFVCDIRVDDQLDGRIDGHCYGTYTSMDGTIISDEFGARFYGVPVGHYDNSKNAGKPSSHHMFAYLYEVAGSILNDPESPWELLPEYEARVRHFEYKGEKRTSNCIFKREPKRL